jgi:hypothetical protein
MKEIALSTKSSTPEPNDLSTEINKLLARIKDESPTTDDYSKLVEQLTKLYKLKELDENLTLKTDNQTFEQVERRAKLSLQEREYDLKQTAADADHRLKTLEANLKTKEVETFGKPTLEKLLPIAGSIAGILVIVGFERTHVIASKALGFVLKR